MADTAVVVAEFTIEPFVEGAPGPHVAAGLDTVRDAGFDPVIGPFGSSITGPLDLVAAAVHELLVAATAAGASRVSLQLSQVEASAPDLSPTLPRTTHPASGRFR